MNGYSRVASLMAANSEIAIVRGFRPAYARDVLYHQAELHHLLQDWATEVKEDQNAEDGDKRRFEYYFEKLWRAEPGEKHNAQWQSWLKVRRKLVEYRQAIATFREVSNESRPDSADVATLRGWLQASGGGNDFLRGSESDTWSSEVEHDLIALAGSQGQDMLSKWVMKSVISWIHNMGDRFIPELKLHDPFLISEPISTPLKRYSNKTIERSVGAVSTILASLFPTMSIFALYYVQSQVVRLSLIALFCVLFSAVLVLVTGAKKIDCFAATAAFAAVQVVFVSQQGNGCVCTGSGG